MELYYKVIIFSVPILIAIKIIFDTRGICFFSGHNQTDNEKMVRMAQEIRFWDWPSKMHSIPYGRGQLREYWVLGLNIISKMLKNKFSDHLNVILAISANLVSSILLYFIVGNYFSPGVGFMVALLYITCFWPYHVAIYIGHVHLAQMFFLFAVYCLQLTGSAGYIYQFAFFFSAGILSAVSFASSSASRKYLPLILAAFLYASRDYLVIPWHDISGFFSLNNWGLFGVLTSVVLISWLVISQNKKLVSALLKKMVRKDWTDEKGADFISRFTAGIFKTLILLVIFCVFFVKNNVFYIYTALYGSGVLLVIIHLLLPFLKLPENINRYRSFLNTSSWATHFNCYKDQVKTFGKKLPESFRGEGLPWIPRFFWRVMPVILILYVMSVLVMGGHQILEVLQENKLVMAAVGDFIWLLGISLLPIIMVEATKGLQVGKSYLPSIMGFLFMIGVSLQISLIFAVLNGLLMVWWGTALAFVFLQFILSIYVFYGDVLPARMAPYRLRNILHMLKVKEFYTYDNPYNEPLVRTMLYTYPDEFKVHYIKSIADVKEGVIVVPGTSSKSVSMESTQYAIENGDFTGDRALNQLYADRKIEKLAMARIKTMGCSRIFVHESEVTSYRDLILKQIADHDRWLANAWVLSASSIK
jgi:hypothetical protein